jgi:hypothetical protein
LFKVQKPKKQKVPVLATPDPKHNLKKKNGIVIISNSYIFFKYLFWAINNNSWEI